MKWKEYPKNKPEEGINVLVKAGVVYQTLRYQEGCWNGKEYEIEGVTHWCYIVSPKRKRSIKEWIAKLRRANDVHTKKT